MTSTTLSEMQNNSPIPPRTADTPTKVYKGGCHCGKFEFECRHPVLEDGFEVLSCNCSICTQRGYLLIYILNPATDFKFTKGSEVELTQYQFKRKVVTHMFCPVCGSGILAKVDPRVNNILIVNARAISELDVQKLTLKTVNGRAL
ncbi:Mss4-like protein [Gautieria morchelliformis]|nr:Mss4-like protein [Gautieria morchelliformis]